MDISKELGLQDLEGEEWKDIEGTESNYSASSLGRIKNNGFTANTYFGGRKVKTKIRKQSDHSQGYKTVLLSMVSKSQQLVHRIVATAFLDNPLNLPFVNHKNGNKKDNRVANLEWCTRQENEDHAFGTHLKNSTGSNNQMAKLTEMDVYEIKKIGRSINSMVLAERYNVNRITIQRVLNGKTWSHVNVF